ncbi:MAG TPA: hypothetical protein PK268_08930 [Enterococcus sp.]|nr:hypothetical protein [Enterococcus sp.]HPR81982.1 hypothetical protein [Enterococcus sp.]
MGGLNISQIPCDYSLTIDLAKTQKMTKCTKYWCVYGGLVGSILGFFQPVVSADSWQVNSVEEIVRRIDSTHSLTMIEGDTVWNIGMALNIKNPMQLLSMNGYQDGEQYTLPVGTVITWDGNYVTVKDQQNQVVGEKSIADNEKINPEKTIANQITDEPQTPAIKEKIAKQREQVAQARADLESENQKTETTPAVPNTKKQELETALADKQAELTALDSELAVAKTQETSEDIKEQANAQQTITEIDVKRQRLETEIAILEAEYSVAKAEETDSTHTAEARNQAIQRDALQKMVLEQVQTLQTLEDNLQQQTVIEWTQAVEDLSMTLADTEKLFSTMEVTATPQTNQMIAAANEALNQKQTQQAELSIQLEQVQNDYQSAQELYTNWLNTGNDKNAEGEQLATTLLDMEQVKNEMVDHFTADLLDFEEISLTFSELASQLATYPPTNQFTAMQQAITAAVQRYK